MDFGELLPGAVTLDTDDVAQVIVPSRHGGIDSEEAAKVDLTVGLKDGSGSGAGQGRRHARSRATLVVAEVALSVGGNAVVLADREGFERLLPVPAIAAAAAEWQTLLEGARVRAERALGRPVTHAAIALCVALEAAVARPIRVAAERAGLEVLRFVALSELPAGVTPVLAAAVLAEDLAPRPEPGTAPGADLV